MTESATGASCTAGVCIYQFTNKIPANATGNLRDRCGSAADRYASAGHHFVDRAWNMARQIRWFTSQSMAHRWRTAATWWRRPTAIGCHVSLCDHGTLAEQHGVLRDVPQPFEHGCHHAGHRHGDRRTNQSPPQGINFNLLVHRIHYGTNMVAAGRNYTVVGLRGQPQRFLRTRSSRR